jgi:hypothetical protein
MSAPAPSLTELLNGAAGLVVVLSGLFAGFGRSVAVVTGASRQHVELATAVGFLVGAFLAVSLMAFAEATG